MKTVSPISASFKKWQAFEDCRRKGGGKRYLTAIVNMVPQVNLIHHLIAKFVFEL